MNSVLKFLLYLGVGLLWITIGTHASAQSPSLALQPDKKVAKTRKTATIAPSTKTSPKSSSTLAPHIADKPGKAKRATANKSTAPKKPKVRPVWNRDLGLGGFAGSWGNMPYMGLRTAIPLSPYLAMRLSLSLFFATQKDPIISYTSFSLGLLVRLPTLFSFIRHYAVTRLEFWPLWNILNINPEITKISEKPTMGISILVGMEIFLVNSLSFVLEAGFSSGMIIGFDTIKTQFEAFGFVMQSGLQMYF